MIERDPTELSGGYSLGRVFLGGLKLYAPPYVDDQGENYPIVVDPAVVLIGWDEEFILVEQHPLGDWIGDRPDSSNPRWHIVVVSTGEVYSDLSYESFLSHREALGIPDTIEMRSAYEVYGE
ncbi:MAG: hypothetical protein GTO63_35755 [Anaerolineae bacterium]|nr:hypothetical protein [Anaerolineae bacterium]NIO00108.1 hypothetical protein [Anaerolineae bacterium]NIQ82879.1 hypothetical protein [Anaerolineae bacterium]